MTEIGNDDDTHWRYLIWATRTLRTLIRKDAPTSAKHIEYFLYAVHDDHPSVVSLTDTASRMSTHVPSTAIRRYFLPATRDHDLIFAQYAQRAVMKAARYIKLRTFCKEPAALATCSPSNPLKKTLPINPVSGMTMKFLEAYKEPLNLDERILKP